MAAAACNPITVDDRYDLDKVDPTVTVVPGVTVDVNQEFTYTIGDFFVDADVSDTFFWMAPDDDPVFDAGDLVFHKDGRTSNISPTVEALFEDAGPAKFQNPFTIYMVDVPGLLDFSDRYTLTNPCLKLQFTSSIAASMLMDITISFAGTAKVLKGVPYAARTSQTVYISAKGGYAGGRTGESDFVFPEMSALMSPLPYETKISSIVFRPDPSASAPAYAPGDVVNMSVLPSMIIPADFTAPSRFYVSVTPDGFKVTPTSSYKVGIYAISAHVEVVNTIPFDLSITGQPNANVKLDMPVIKAGSLEAPVTTEGDISIEYSDYSSISTLVADLAAEVTSLKSQLNSKQGLTLRLKSVTIPEGVEIEFTDFEEEAER